MFKVTPYRGYDLLNVFRDFEKDFFGSEMPVNTCKVDIRDEGNKLVLEAEMPGFKKEDIKIDIEGGLLKLSAERKKETEGKGENTKGVSYIRRERSYGSYQRSFNIEDIDADGIEAEYTNGVLVMSLPKRTPETPSSRRLDIK